MSLQEQYEFDSIDASQVAESPELPEMFAALLDLYRTKCQSEVRQQETIQSLLDRLYGPKSEKSKYHPDQKLLLPELLEAFSETEIGDPEVRPSAPPESKQGDAVKPTRNGGHGRSKLPGHLERRVVDRVDMDVPNCDSCGQQRPILRIEKSERLNYVPARAIVDVTEVVIRGPLPCQCDEDAPRLVRPERPMRPIDGGMPGVELLTSIVIGKFHYHLPHYRQATKTLKDAGITLSKQTLWDWTRKTAELLDPLWELMHQKLLAEDHQAADETTVQMVDRDRPGSPTKKTYLWEYFGFEDDAAPYTVFDFALTRAHTAPKKFLEGFSGTLLTDGYSAYRKLPNLTHAGCMAHARRKFEEAMVTSPVIAARAVALIGKLYQVEKACKSLDAKSRAAYRRRHSTGHLLRLRLLLEQEKPQVMPASRIAKAIGYTLNQWPDLCRFVDDGRLPIDNNAAEREMKAIATGRKNWLFFGSERGGRVAAIIYSILASARRHDLDVWRYLTDILPRLADLNPGELQHLLPDAWLREQELTPPPTADQASSHTA
jgi:transposase